jgi:hypothetical protein
MSKKYKDDGTAELISQIDESIIQAYTDEYGTLRPGKSGRVIDGAAVLRRLCNAVMEESFWELWSTVKDQEFKAMNPAVWFQIIKHIHFMGAGKPIAMMNISVNSPNDLKSLTGQQMEDLYMEIRKLEMHRNKGAKENE